MKDKLQKMIDEAVSPMRKYLKQIDKERDRILAEAFVKRYGKETGLLNHRLLTRQFNIVTEDGWKEIYAVGREVYAMCYFEEAIEVTSDGINGRIDLHFDIPKEPLYIDIIDGRPVLSHQKSSNR